MQEDRVEREEDTSSISFSFNPTHLLSPTPHSQSQVKKHKEGRKGITEPKKPTMGFLGSACVRELGVGAEVDRAQPYTHAGQGPHMSVARRVSLWLDPVRRVRGHNHLSILLTHRTAPAGRFSPPGGFQALRNQKRKPCRGGAPSHPASPPPTSSPGPSPSLRRLFPSLCPGPSPRPLPPPPPRRTALARPPLPVRGPRYGPKLSHPRDAIFAAYCCAQAGP